MELDDQLDNPNQTKNLLKRLLIAVNKLKLTDKKLPSVTSYANDAAAATGGVAIGGLYHTSGAVKIRLV